LKETLIIAGYQGSDSIHTKSVEYFIDELSSDFITNFIMDITNDGDKASSLIEKTQQGEIHASYLLSSYFEKILPEIQILDLPYLFNSRNEAYNSLRSDLFNYIDNKLKNKNLKLLGFWDNGIRHISSKIKLIKNLSDCKGQVIRTTPSPLHIEIFRKLGFIPKPLDVRDFKLAVEKNDIDAQENPLTNYWNFGVYKKQEFVSLTSHIFGFCLFVINDDYFNKLSDLNKKFLINKSKETTKFQRRLAISEDDILIKKIKSKNIKIENIDKDGLEDFKRATNNFHENYFQTYPHMKEYIKT
jgi:TRAP-type C4-dicarboxylate transport system substrate-binding protein|tara:strand:- start:4509 stop:5408 length:900 start_codon:yes stop_codon:yes gene_type:complete